MFRTNLWLLDRYTSVLFGAAHTMGLNSEYLLVENQDPELRPWGNTSSSAIQGHNVVSTLHRPLHISWQWYPLDWAFHTRDTQAYRYFRQTVQRLEADRIEFTDDWDEETALQCPCHLCIVKSASLYFSKRGAYWDRLCRDVVGRWLVVTRVHCGQTVHPRPIVTMEH